MAQDDQDRNLPASPRKLQKAREDGQVARSRDLQHLGAVALGGALIVATAPWWAGWMRERLVAALRFDAAMLAHPETMLQQLAVLAGGALVVILPLGIAMALIAIASGVIVGGWNFTLKPLAPNFDKLNPLAGLGRIVSKQQLVDALKACALALLLAAVGGFWLRGHLSEFAAMAGMPVEEALARAGDTMLGGLVLVLLALAVFAAIDAPLQRQMLANRLKMSRAELKQEQKEVEGNAEVKGKIRVRMREMSRRRMLAAVPSADLVVMNPTHYAVALKYDDRKMAAPRVVAKGADLLAMTIRDAAKAAKVPVLQAPVLARALYAHAEVDREIPAALFAAVAQVLAYVYQLRAALTGAAPMPGDLPHLPVPAELDPHNKVEDAAEEE